MEHFDHQELVVAGFSFGHANHVLEDLCVLVREGARFESGQTGVAVVGADVAFGGVHPVHLRSGLMNLWLEHADRSPDPPELRVLQALLDPAADNLRLDRPHVTLHRGRKPHYLRRRT